jgi:hypothetical protein
LYGRDRGDDVPYGDGRFKVVFGAKSLGVTKGHEKWVNGKGQNA